MFEYLRKPVAESGNGYLAWEQIAGFSFVGEMIVMRQVRGHGSTSQTSFPPPCLLPLRSPVLDVNGHIEIPSVKTDIPATSTKRLIPTRPLTEHFERRWNSNCR